MRQLFLAMIVGVLGVSAIGQTQSGAATKRSCDLTVAQSPAIRHIRLGMKLDEVLGLFPGSREDPGIRSALSQADKQFGMAMFGVDPNRDAYKEKLEGISRLGFQFLDNRLTSLYVGYNGPEWKSIDEFISRLSESLNLPGPKDWDASNIININGLKTLRCEGFEITASIGGTGGNSNSVHIHSLIAEQIVRDRREEVKEKARKEFKP
jgi:hypothetical protein